MKKGNKWKEITSRFKHALYECAQIKHGNMLFDDGSLTTFMGSSLKELIKLK